MKRNVWIGLLVLAGCVPSLHPLYTEKDLIFDPGLVGEWTQADGEEILAFAKRGEKEYRMVYTGHDGKQGRFQVRLLKVNERLFLDVFPTEPDSKDSDFYKLHLVPAHTFMLVKQIRPTLQMAFLDPEWTKKYLEKHPEAVRHEKVNDGIVLTAGPKELQAFVLQHEKDAFHEMGTFTRKGSAKGQPTRMGLYRDRVVQTVSRKLPALPPVAVSDADKFLNDLKLSPFWQVRKDQKGDFVAHARAIVPENDLEAGGRQFLFELFSEPTIQLPKAWRIGNRYILGRHDFTSLSATIVFSKPTDVDFCQEDGSITLGVHDSYQQVIGPNSTSTLAIPLNKTGDIYLLVREQGQDKARTTTFAKLPRLIEAAASVAALPARYRVEEQYKRFFEKFFEFPLKEMEVKQLPGSQNRDTFYGYFKSKPDTCYEGINIRISHPVYCKGECTRESSRLGKAEYLGKPYFDTDPLFFLIEDNAVYLQFQYNEQFGTFSGNNSFEGTLEILNGAGRVLYKGTDKFKGWER